MSAGDDDRMSGPMILASGVRKRFGSVEAVAGVDLTVRRGEIYALLGTNGAGKTTLLEIIEGLVRPDEGSVRIDGHDPRDRQRTQPLMGVMMQEGGLANDLTAEESVRLLGSISGREDDPRRLLERVGLADKTRRRVSALSGGERRRVEFAAAIWGAPPVIFLDEPTTGLDPSARQALWDIVDGLRGDGTTVLLTTHYLEEAERHADRIGLMHEGVLRREGTLADLVGVEPSAITFISPVPVDELPLPAAGLRGEHVVVESTDVQADLAALLSWASDRGVELADLRASASSLDEVFRSLNRAS